MIRRWKFNDKKNTAVFTTVQVINREMPILYVSHDEDDGTWQFHDGSDASIRNAMVVTLSEIISVDITINQLSELPLGWIATRDSVNDLWKIEKKFSC